MDALRIILLLIGVCIILGIYIYSRRPGISSFRHIALQIKHKIFSSRSASTPHIKPDDDKSYRFELLDDTILQNLSGLVAAKDEEVELQQPINNGDANDNDNEFRLHVMDDSDVASSAKEDYLLVLNIKAKNGEVITGERLMDAIKLAGLQFGEHDIFHRHVIVHDKVQKTPVCSLANIFEPGTFKINEMQEFETTGLVMFMQLPGPISAEAAFENTLRTAQKLSLELDARLCDDSHSILTTQTIGHIKEAMKAYDFRQRMQSTNKQHH